MRVLLTGIAGFIGSHLARALTSRGHEVVGLDNFDAFYARSVKEENLAGLADLRFVEGDVLDQALLDRLLGEARFDVIAHLAGLAGVAPSLTQAPRYQRVNVEGSAIIADAAVRHGVPGLVFASSSSVYGGNTKVPFDEDDRVDSPVSPYAASKRSAELVLRSIHHTTGLGVTALRFFTVYGPRQRPDMAIHKFCKAIHRGEAVTMRGDGTMSRDYTYVDDIIRGTVAAVERVSPRFRVYNLGGSRTTTLTDLVRMIAEALGRPARVERVPTIRGDVEQTHACIARAEAELDYRTDTPIEEGIRRFVAWYCERNGRP